MKKLAVDRRSWAVNEVMEVVDATSCDYIKDCYRSALNAYNELLDDNHSGVSMEYALAILTRLVNNKPLTELTNNEDDWSKVCTKEDTDETLYQHKRYSKLFKTITKEGDVSYNDMGRIRCFDINDGYEFYTKTGADVINELYPIEFPYYPEEPIMIYIEEFLADESKRFHDFDTRGIIKAILPDGSEVPLNRFYHQPSAADKMIEIPKNMYDILKKMAI